MKARWLKRSRLVAVLWILIGATAEKHMSLAELSRIISTPGDLHGDRDFLAALEHGRTKVRAAPAAAEPEAESGGPRSWLLCLRQTESLMAMLGDVRSLSAGGTTTVYNSRRESRTCVMSLLSRGDVGGFTDRWGEQVETAMELPPNFKVMLSHLIL